ncbi:GAF and ANTAR domain-containing protein [Streptomyces flavofungini]|uniref:GAF and ANTAR domain-containing protein n=1 Tax=Streptomyces flavofungini TaxID=68200 RepID=UPI0025B24324|nr:GAF and ANTAR domain-containing protein [Streptomyces flavofungini]WJV48107.1 GAF and ANTAR domain-containing protein [Streptomyces flavofungini]
MPAPVPDLTALLTAATHTSQGLAALPPAVCADALGVDGLTISLLDKRGLELIWYDPADTAGTAFEDLQYTLGEGPACDAARTGEPVVVPDLRTLPEHRWPALLPAVRALPVRAVFALPLHLGAIHLGALTGHRSAPGHPTRAQMADALALAEAATLILLTPAGTSDLSGHNPLPLHRALIHQAAGVITVRLDIPIDQALARLRAYAFTHDRPILEVAHDVVHHHFRLDSPAS